MLALLLFLPLAGCQPEALAPPQCERAPSEGVGAWSHVALPVGVYLPGDSAATDGKNLVVVDAGYTECKYYVLDAASGEWQESDGPSLTEYATPGYIIANERVYYFTLSSRTTGDSGHVEYTHQRQIYDREESIWSTVTIPDYYRSEWRFWTGSDFLFWGGTAYETDIPILYPDTPAVRFYDGALFNPSTGEWRQIPPAREDAEYLWGDDGPSLASIWTSSGLFVWGRTAPILEKNKSIRRRTTTSAATACWGAITQSAESSRVTFAGRR